MSKSEMVERVALIVNKHACFACEGCNCRSADECDGVATDTDRIIARAAIAAMREPTEAMLDLEELRHHEGSGAPDFHGAHAWILRADKHVWQAMIDAALKEGE